MRGVVCGVWVRFVRCDCVGCCVRVWGVVYGCGVRGAVCGVWCAVCGVWCGGGVYLHHEQLVRVGEVPVRGPVQQHVGAQVHVRAEHQALLRVLQQRVRRRSQRCQAHRCRTPHSYTPTHEMTDPYTERA